MHSHVTVNEAQQLILQAITPLSAESCRIEACHGRFLAEPITADRDFPPYHRIMMDGYALRSAEYAAGQTTFEVASIRFAGDSAISLPEQPGCCLEVMTGGVLPKGADCIIPYEWTERTDNRIRLREGNEPKAGLYIHPQGTDAAAGSELLPSGKQIKAADLNLLHACGYQEVSVVRQPSILVVSTGDEAVPVEMAPQPHQIRRSNAPSLASTLISKGYTHTTHQHWPDAAGAINEALSSALLNYDIILISGGISKGKKDYVASSLEELGAVCHFHRVRQRPGHPMGYWTTENCHIFGLPGNPVSTFTTFHRHVWPALARLQGGHPAPPECILLQGLQLAAERTHTLFIPVRQRSDGSWTRLDFNNSGDFIHYCSGEGFVEVSPEDNFEDDAASLPLYRWL